MPFAIKHCQTRKRAMVVVKTPAQDKVCQKDGGRLPADTFDILVFETVGDGHNRIFRILAARVKIRSGVRAWLFKEDHLAS